MLALVGVFGSAGAFTSIRYIGSRAHPLLSVNYFSAFCTLISFLALTLSKPLQLSETLSLRLPSSLRQWGMLIFLGTCGFTMQYLLTKGIGGNGKKSGARGMNMVYTNMLFAVALDRWVFGVVPGWWSLAGSGCILGCAVYIALGKEEETMDGRDGEQGDEENGSRHRTEEGGTEEERRGMLDTVDAEDEDENATSIAGDVELQEIPSSRHD
jgi:drug/metabolite transporter (DMT)-like permease